MELPQLKYFVAVAEARSFTEAARRLHISQPALSYQVKRLEREVGTALFDRTSRRITLTADGKAFLPLAQDILRKVDEAAHFMNERLGVARGEVSLGTIHSVATQVIPHILATFKRNFPGVSVRVVEKGSVELAAAVSTGELDLAITSSLPVSESLAATALIAEELLLVVPQSHELAARRSVSLRALSGYDWILPSAGFTLAQQILDECRRAGFEPRVAYRTGTLESIRSFVRHDLGIAILPRLALDDTEDDLVVVVPLEEQITRDLTIIEPKDRHPSAAAQALAVHIQTTLFSTFSSVGRPLAIR